MDQFAQVINHYLLFANYICLWKSFNEALFHGVGLCQDLVIPVTNFHSEDKGFMVLAGDVFDVPIRKDIVHRVVRWQLAKRQQVVIDLYFWVFDGMWL